jgi:hypothetical protein
MIRSTRFFIIITVLAITLCWYQTAFAASTLVLAPSTDGSSYVLQGIGMENAAAMDIIVFYDPATLASPQITQGAMINGAMIAVNDTVPGTVRMGIVRTTPVTGTGVIVTLTFSRKGDAVGKILGVKASLSSIDGKPLPVVAQIGQQMDTTADASGGSSANTGISMVPIPGAKTGPVVATGPAGGDANKDKAAVRSSGTGTPGSLALSRSTSLSADARGITASSDGSKIQQYDSVLKKIKKYKGARTPKALVGFFAQDEMTGYRQDPAVALSDGRTPVRITFISTAGEKKAADVAVIGARLLSLKKDPEYTNTWVLELIPEKDTYDASVAVSEGTLKRIYPLTVAPRIDMKIENGAQATEKDLGLYLSAQRQDVNKDGKKNYIDDYIYTANYLFLTKNNQSSEKK